MGMRWAVSIFPSALPARIIKSRNSLRIIKIISGINDEVDLFFRCNFIHFLGDFFLGGAHLISIIANYEPRKSSVGLPGPSLRLRGSVPLATRPAIKTSLAISLHPILISTALQFGLFFRRVRTWHLLRLRLFIKFLHELFLGIYFLAHHVP